MTARELRHRSIRARLALPLACLLLLGACGREQPERAALTVFAAASLMDVLPKIAEAWKAEGGTSVRFSWGATSKLVPQVIEGAPADALFSADEAWMDKLESAGMVDGGTRRVVATNSLVYIVPSTDTGGPTSVADLVTAPPQRLAMAGENVPAGKYGKAALLSGKAWSAVERSVKGAEDVRGALRWVATGEADGGIVYRTDAAAEPRVRVAFTFAPESHPPIVYPAAVITGSKRRTEARRFLEFVGGPKAQALLAAAGFGAPGP